MRGADDAGPLKVIGPVLPEGDSIPLPRLLPSPGLSRGTEPPAAEISRILRNQICLSLSHPALNFFYPLPPGLPAYVERLGAEAFAPEPWPRVVAPRLNLRGADRLRQACPGWY